MWLIAYNAEVFDFDASDATLRGWVGKFSSNPCGFTGDHGNSHKTTEFSFTNECMLLSFYFEDDWAEVLVVFNDFPGSTYDSTDKIDLISVVHNRIIAVCLMKSNFLRKRLNDWLSQYEKSWKHSLIIWTEVYSRQMMNSKKYIIMSWLKSWSMLLCRLLF